jgi:hypothetical protein
VRRSNLPRRLALLTLALSLLLAGLGASPAFANCPTPSWVQVVANSGRLDSRYPNVVAVLWTADVTHWGDVKPGTRATFDYDSYDATTGRYLETRRYVTQAARGNGIIPHEFGYRRLSDLVNVFSVGGLVEVRYSFTDECGRGTVVGAMGFILVT